MAKQKVAVLVGSDSDLDVIRHTESVFKTFQVPYEIHIFSAHRTPQKTLDFAQKAKDRGFQVIIAAAGMSAHLAGVVAAHTTLPVIGVPLEGKLEGLDALLSTVQMPKGIPVATVALGKTGAHNAALLAIEILALSNHALDVKLKNHRKKMTKEVLEKDKRLQKRK
ncbi:MAG: 5-(carboxyamino)imidazole ribonucleotide mutase [Deltaproteobacteria bacterium RIFCSPHIGHO2_02_FULL_40_11]|nr:MAG: 5-(carboxyamino)imidazole ribonucleotide mutase [Deltaproteobacteria bacterium RIFCSPHIGHO2_02_FULL_40_11]